MPTTTISHDTSHPVMPAVRRFRYEVYVAEMGRPQKYADHERREIAEPLDEISTHLTAVDDRGSVVGVVRYTACDAGDLGDYVEYYQFERFRPFYPARCSLTTKLMVAASYRKGTLATRLSLGAYKGGLNAGFCLNFIDCNAHLVPYFSALGFLPFPSTLSHPEYGDVRVMALPMTDHDHLATCRSPFLPALRANKATCDMTAEDVRLRISDELPSVTESFHRHGRES